MPYVLDSYVASGYFVDLTLEPYDSAGEFAAVSTGFYDKFKNNYQANSVETWDDYDASSAGVDWDSFTSWSGTPNTSVVFLTDVIDARVKKYYNPLCSVVATGPANITVYYGDSLDSSGAIESATSYAGSQSTTLNGVEGRYFQFKVEIDQVDNEISTITSINSILKNTGLEEIISDLDTSTIVDSTGFGTITPTKTFSAIQSVFIQPQANSISKPMVYVRTKSTSGIDFEVFDADTYGKTHIDCVVDVKITGLPKYISDANGNLTEELE